MPSVDIADEEEELLSPGGDENAFEDASFDDCFNEANDHEDNKDVIMAFGDADSERDELPPGTDYLIKHWLNHGRDATNNIAHDLYQSGAFWVPSSKARERWLRRYDALTGVFKGTGLDGMTALHVAASIGFPRLVEVLIEKGREGEAYNQDAYPLRPLHLAAHFGRNEIIKQLLRRKQTNINDGTEERNDTPLHLAARAGHLDVMESLLNCHANPNHTSDKHGTVLCAAIMSDKHGTVLCAAIMSGKLAAVRKLLEYKTEISLTTEHDEDSHPPLVVASTLCGLETVEALLEADDNRTMAKDYGRALVAAEAAGNGTILSKFLQNMYGRAEDGAAAMSKFLQTKYSPEVKSLQAALQSAAEGRHWGIVEQLLEHSEPFKQRLDCNEAFRLVADDPGAEDGLLQRIWDYSERRIERITLNDALYRALDLEKKSMVEILLKRFGANANAAGKEYGNALTAAANDGTTEIVRLLLEHQAKVNSPDGWALQAAASQGHLFVVKQLFKRGADLNNQSNRTSANTALQAAVEARHKDIVEFLLEHKANPDLGGGYYTYPIMAATLKPGNEDILKLLLHAGASPEVHGGPTRSTPLNNAVVKMSVKSVQLLVDAGTNVNLANENGDTPLILAAQQGDTERLEILLGVDAKVDHVSVANGTALHAAAQAGSVECCQMLLAAQADTRVRGGKHGTVLQAAAMSSNLGCFQLILDDQVNVDVEGGHYHSGLQGDATSGNRRCVELLLERDARVNNGPGSIHGTALQAAAATGHDDIVRLLLQHGADPNIKIHNGAASGGNTGSGDVLVGKNKYRSALHAAVLNCMSETCQLLLEHDAEVTIESADGRDMPLQLVVEAATRQGDEGTLIVELLLGRLSNKSLNAALMCDILEAAAGSGSSEMIDLARRFNSPAHMTSKPIPDDFIRRLEERLSQKVSLGATTVKTPMSVGTPALPQTGSTLELAHNDQDKPTPTSLTASPDLYIDERHSGVGNGEHRTNPYFHRKSSGSFHFNSVFSGNNSTRTYIPDVEEETPETLQQQLVTTTTTASYEKRHGSVPAMPGLNLKAFAKVTSNSTAKFRAPIRRKTAPPPTIADNASSLSGGSSTIAASESPSLHSRGPSLVEETVGDAQVVKTGGRTADELRNKMSKFSKVFG